MRSTRRLPPTLVVIALLVAVPGCVSAHGQPWGSPQASGGRTAYDNGYRRGFDQGIAEARLGHAADYRNDRAYRDADWGYDPRYGPRGQYRQVFRSGYQAGYREGHGRYATRSYGRAVPRSRDYPYSYPEPGYGRNAPRGSYGGYGYATPAFERGRREGYEKGLEDASDRDRFDPLRHKWYREGDRGYNSRYGSREQYKSDYRDAFRRGYEEGYGDGQRGSW